MKHVPYPCYKPSGVEWLGEVPEYWSLRKLKQIVDVPITDGPHATPELQDEGVPFLSVEAVWGGKVHIEAMRGFISEEADTEYSRKYKPKLNDIYIVKSGSTTGKVALVDVDVQFNIWSPLAAVRCSITTANPKFVYYALSSEYFQRLVEVSWSFGTQPNIGMDVLQNLQLLIPPLVEQRTIADFLDREMTRLDTLIAKKRELIERLKEKRTALISRTVTRGLPPDAARAAGLDPHPRLKASGIEWLDEVPEHWDMKPLKFTCKIGNGSTPSRENADYWFDGEYPWLNSSVVNMKVVTEASDFVTDLALSECHLPIVRPPAVLIGITGQGKTRGMAALLGIEATINQHLAYLKPHASKGEAPFINYVMQSAYTFLRDESDGGGSTKGALTCEQLGNVTIPLPPLGEQRAIANYLDYETEKIDSMVQTVEAAISKLQEYRTALITAAVTGKIDVRNSVP